MTVPAAFGREDVAAYLEAVIIVYSVVIIAHVLLSMVFSLGARVPYSRWSRAVMEFLHDVSEPYLAVFRRFIPMIGPFDLSPIAALLVLNFVGGLVVSLIRG